MLTYIPANLPPTTGAFSQDPKDDFVSIHEFAEDVIAMLGHKYGITIDSKDKPEESNLAAIVFVTKVLVLAAHREREHLDEMEKISAQAKQDAEAAALAKPKRKKKGAKNA